MNFEEASNSTGLVQHTTQKTVLTKDSDKTAIPSPFKQVLFFPKPKITTKNKKKEKVSSIASEQFWLYHEKKRL